MPIALIAIGLIFLVVSVRGTAGEFMTLLRSDFSGQGNFVQWFVAIVLLGSLGYVKSMRGLSTAFLALLIIVLLLSNRGFFGENGFFYQIRNHQVVQGKSVLSEKLDQLNRDFGGTDQQPVGTGSLFGITFGTDWRKLF